MIRAKLGKDNRINFPKEISFFLNIKAGDTVEFEKIEGKIILKKGD